MTFGLSLIESQVQSSRCVIATPTATTSSVEHVLREPTEQLYRGFAFATRTLVEADERQTAVVVHNRQPTTSQLEQLVRTEPRH